MLKAYGFIFCATANNLSRLSLKTHSNELNEALSDENKRGVVKIVSDIELACRDLDLPVTVAKIMRIANRLTDKIVPLGEIKNELKHLNETLQDEVKTKLFLRIPNERALYYIEANPFGDAVATAFPSASFDIQESGKCFACERYTATVFHLMCATEHTMRALAWDRRVNLTTKGGASFPTMMGTWEDVLRELEKEAVKIGNWSKSRGEVKVQALQFYNAAIEEFRAVKDAWRNPVMHARRHYTEEDAAQVMAHVKRLTTILSTRISETERTPRVWTKAQLR